MTEDCINYILLNSKIPFRCDYGFIETEDFQGAKALAAEHLKPKLIDLCRMPDKPYYMMWCRIWKKDIEAFEKAMDSLARRALICGHSDYVDVSTELFTKVIQRAEARHISNEKKKKGLRHGKIHTAE